ncbi:MAG TPA: site-2 protease family protein [Actinomycetota bacterium]
MAGTVAEVSFFVALIVVIVIHEAAHFGMAKWFGIKVEEFFVGFGPRLWSFRRGETEYGVKAIPAGGYVKIAGMDPYEETSAEALPRTFGAKPIWQRALVIFAGPATHFVLAFIVFAIWLAAVGQPVSRGPLVAGVTPTLGNQASPAAVAGLRAGDRIVGIDDISDPTDVQLVRYTRNHVGEPVTLRILRDGSEFTVTVTPVLSKVDGEKVGRIGVLLGFARETAGLAGSVSGAAHLVATGVVDSVKGIARLFGPDGVGRIAKLLFTDAEREQTDVVSVVGIGRVAAQTASGGRFWDMLWIFGLVNVFIGLLNLLPLPPFDGGHLAVLAIEKVRGRRVDMRKMVPISVAVAAVFILLFVAVVYLDITKPVQLYP